MRKIQSMKKRQRTRKETAEKEVEKIPEIQYTAKGGRKMERQFFESPGVRTHAGGLKLLLCDLGKSALLLLAATGLGHIFWKLGFTEANIITVYILAVLIISVLTTSRVCSLLASVVSVIVFNFFFTMPRFTFHVYEQGYPVTFVIMFLAAFLTGTLAAKLKDSTKQSAAAAYRTKILLEMNQILQQCHSDKDVISSTANQLTRLLKRDMAVYLSRNGELLEPYLFCGQQEGREKFLREKERNAALWVLKNNRRAGAGTETFQDVCCHYLALRVNDQVYGVIGIAMENGPLDEFEKSVLLSILGECALALENIKNAKEKEEAAILAKNEQLRADMLRSISHDLRTPLTSISGNASNLISNYQKLDDEMREQIFEDIYDDSMWLINLVENLLSVTRIEEGRMKLNISAQLVDEVIEEALRHVNRKSAEHEIVVDSAEEFVLARMDARLIVQVLINMVDNAVKYTPCGSEIRISSRKKGKWVEISVADNGPGIPDEQKPRIFDTFFSGTSKIADSRRSLGLGLSLCKSIVTAHGGSISVTDNQPSGAVFTFTLPAEEVELYE